MNEQGDHDRGRLIGSATREQLARWLANANMDARRQRKSKAYWKERCMKAEKRLIELENHEE